MKFKHGDRVEFTAEARQWNPRAHSTTGVVVKCERDRYGQIKVKRDGLKTVEAWHEDAWQPRSEE